MLVKESLGLQRMNQYSQNVVEGNVLGDMSIGDDELDILWAVTTDLVPEE